MERACYDKGVKVKKERKSTQGGQESVSDDERRLFYVAMTRARKGVTITYSKTGQDGQEELPSQFVEEINPELVERVSVEQIEKTFRENQAKRMGQTRVRKVSMKNKTYLNELFLTQGFSVTALNNYLECPWRYFYNNLIRIPHAQNKHMLYGTVVHATLRDFFEKYRTNDDLSKKQLLELFEQKLKKQPLAESEFEETLEKGNKAFAGYCDTYRKIWHRNILNEFKIKGVLFDIGKQEISLTGVLDKIEFLNDHEVNVVDYKTGKPKSRNAIIKAGYYRQLVFYKLLLDLLGSERSHRSKSGETAKYRMVSGEIDFIEPSSAGTATAGKPDEKGKYRKEKFEVSDTDIEELKETITRVSREILTLSFWDTNCDDKDCDYCVLRKMMI